MTYSAVEDEEADDARSTTSSCLSSDLSYIDDYLKEDEKLTHGEGEHHLDHGDNVEITPAVGLFTLGASLHSCMIGYDQGVSTHISMLIQKEFELSDWERGFYIAFLFVFMIVGAIGSPFISDRHGRRAALATSCYAFMAGTLLMLLTNHFYGLLIGRAICGVGAGIGFMVDAMYIAEISPAVHRGELVTRSYTALTIGLLLGISAGFILGFLKDETRWRTMLFVGMGFPIGLIAISIKVLIESPRFLLMRKRSKEARSVLMEIYPKGYCVNAVLEDIRHSLQREKQSQEERDGWILPSPAFRQMLFIGFAISFVQEAVGADALQYYALDLLEDAHIQPAYMQHIAMILLIVIKIQCIVICSQLLDMFGRKMMLFFSLAGISAALVVLSISFYLPGYFQPVLAMFALFAYTAFYGIGLGPTSRLLPVELFPTGLRAKALCVAVIISRGTAAILSATLLSWKDAVSWQEILLGLSASSVVVGIYLACVLPETKNLSLEEMALQFAEITNDVELQATERKLRGAEIVHGFDCGANRRRLNSSSSDVGTRMLRV